MEASGKQALVCPACASPFIEFFVTAFGSDVELPETPKTVACTGPSEHRYPVIQIDSAPDGKRLYTLGPEMRSGD
jgi:ABC-type Fe3+-hydroxamate transport system substrate-binding protein